MNWKRGFKRISHVVAIVIAVACGVIAVYLPIQWRKDAGEMSLERMEEYRESARYDAVPREYGMSPEAFLQLEKTGGKLPDGKSPAEAVFQQTRRYIDYQLNQRFWYRLSTNEFKGLVVLYVLGGVVGGYVVTYGVLWTIVLFIHWLVLGFSENKKENEQKK
jgi:hypothetical protein